MGDLVLTAFFADVRGVAGQHPRAQDAPALERGPAVPRRVREMFLPAHTREGGAVLMVSPA